MRYHESGPLRVRLVNLEEPRDTRILAHVPNDDGWFRAFHGWPYVSRDGLTLYYAQGGQQPSVMALSLEGGEPQPIVSFPGGFTTLRPFAWITDHHLLALGAYTHSWSAPETTPSQVLLIDITTGEVRPITGLLPPYTSVLSVERLP